MTNEYQQAVFMFQGNLQDFLATSQKGKPLVYAFKGKPSLKDAIEAMGVPHVEVGAITVNGVPSSFQEQLLEGAQVEVFCVMQERGQGVAISFQLPVPSPIQFVLDVHLGKLARLLRLLGFDAAYETHYTDKILAETAEQENRVVLTRDIGLLKHKTIRWGYWLRSQNSEEQLLEVLQRFQLQCAFKPFTRCMVCNHLVEPVSKEAVVHQLPPKTRQYFEEFYQCTGCQKVYWKGSHYDKMQAFVNRLSL